MKVTFKTADAAMVYKAFKTALIEKQFDTQAVLTEMGNIAILNANADDWEQDIKREVELVKEWQVGEALQIGNIRRFEGNRYVVIQAHTTQADWTPPLVPALFLLIPENTDSGYPLWVQPTGAQDAYNLGDRVTHNEQNWESTINAHTTEPEVTVFNWWTLLT